MKRFIAHYDRQKAYIMDTIVGPIIMVLVSIASTLTAALLIFLVAGIGVWIMKIAVILSLEAVVFIILVIIFKKTWRKRNKLYHQAIETTFLWAMIVLVLFDIVVGGRPPYIY
jgi:hypothetical protein